MNSILNQFFLTFHDRICCLLSSTILLPMSLFIIATTIRQVSMITSTEDIYIVSIKTLSSMFGVLASILTIFSSIACPHRRICIINITLSTISAFGIMMSMATIFFHANWGGHHEAVSKVIFIIVSSLCLVCSVAITMRIALRFKSEYLIDQDHTIFLEQCSIILATLLIIASFTAISGFIIGYIIKWQLLMDKIFGGGLHSGIIGLLSSLVFLAAVYGGPKSRFSLLAISMGVSMLSLISAAVSFYTEEIEIENSMQFIIKNHLLFYYPFHYRKLLLMTKSTLVLISSIFGLVFGTPLTVATCCLLKKDLIILPEQQQHKNETEFDFMCSTIPNHDLYRNQIFMKTELSNHQLCDSNSFTAENSYFYPHNSSIVHFNRSQLALNNSGMKEEVCDLLKEIGHNR